MTIYIARKLIASDHIIQITLDQPLALMTTFSVNPIEFSTFCILSSEAFISHKKIISGLWAFFKGLRASLSRHYKCLDNSNPTPLWKGWGLEKSQYNFTTWTEQPLLPSTQSIPNYHNHNQTHPKSQKLGPQPQLTMQIFH